MKFKIIHDNLKWLNGITYITCSIKAVIICLQQRKNI